MGDEMGYSAPRRNEVSSENLVDRLELSEAACHWALMEFEEAYHLRLFKYESWEGMGSDEPGWIIVGRTPGWGADAV